MIERKSGRTELRHVSSSASREEGEEEQFGEGVVVRKEVRMVMYHLSRQGRRGRRSTLESGKEKGRGSVAEEEG